MADYEQDIGVKLYSDFASLQKSMTTLQNKMNAVSNSMKSILTTSSQIGSVAHQINKMANSIKVISANSNKFGKIFNNTNMAGLNNALEKIRKINTEFSLLLQKMNATSQVGTLKSTNDASLSNAKSMSSYAIPNDAHSTRNKQIISYIKNLDTAKQKTAELGKESGKTGLKITKMFSVGKIYFFFNYFKQVFRGIGNIITNALDFNEVENMFSNAMKGSYDKAMQFQTKLSEMFGVAMPTTMQAQATYKNMLGNLGGISDELSYQLSETVTKMTLDFASLYNVSFEDSVKKFQSLLSKQVRPIRSVSGYDITQSVLGMTASEIGMSKSITQANELEKRLLAVLTVYKQMGAQASNAMNDFSRTVEQPANQLRVLQEQLQELGRWIGSIFMGTIGAILPYINGFIMALKEIAKTIALFVGYEMPDSSGLTGTMLDNVEATDELGDSIGNVGAGLSDAKEKANELKGSLAGFDKLNIINKPKDTDASGGAGGGGAAGMTVDPALLKALEQMQYRFDDISMKAKEIRDQLLAWVDIIKNNINEHIFKPIANSWDKYGKGILDQFNAGFSNLGSLLGSVAEEFGKNFNVTMQNASDLFFSLFETASIVFEQITYALKKVWDSGGKDLYNGISDLINAFLKLAIAVNDKFIKPMLNGFRNILLPVISDFVGFVLKGFGKVLDVFADFIEWFSECKPLVVGLGSAFVGMFAAIKIAKFIELMDNVKNANSIFSKLITVLYDHNSVFKKVIDLWINGDSKVKALKKTWSTANKLIADTGVWKSLVSMLKNVWGHVTTLTERFTFLSPAVTGLTKVFSFLAANPLVAVAVGIGGVVAGLTLLGSSTKESKYELEDYSKHIQNNIKDLQELRQSLKDASDDAASSFDSKLADIEVVDTYIKKLNDMSNSDGYVQNINQAQAYIEKINSVMPDTVSLTKDYRLEWKKTPDEINKTIEALKEKAKVEAYSELYTKSLTAQITAERKIKQAIDDRKKAQERLNELIKIGSENWSGAEFNEFNQLQADIEGFNETIKEGNGVVKESADNMAYYQSAMKFTSEQVSIANQNMSTSFKQLSDEQKNDVTSMIENLSILKTQHDEYVNAGIKLDSKKMKSNKDATKAQIEDMVELGKQYGLTYDDMLLAFNNYGIKLNEEELKLMQNSFNNAKTGKEELKHIKNQQKEELIEILRQQGIDEKNENYQKYLDALADAQKKGTDEGQTFIDNYKASLKNGKEPVGKAAKEVGKIIEDTFNLLNPTTTVYTKVDNYSLNAAIGSFKTAFGTILNGMNPILEKVFKVKIPGFAGGGFPNYGEMFIARENGIPELVGRMGSKTAVANNDQIVAGIEEASFRGMLRALSLSSGNKKSNIPIVNEITVKIGEETIEKQIKKADQRSIKKTGKGLLER